MALNIFVTSKNALLLRILINKKNTLNFANLENPQIAEVSLFFLFEKKNSV